MCINCTTTSCAGTRDLHLPLLDENLPIDGRGRIGAPFFGGHHHTRWDFSHVLQGVWNAIELVVVVVVVVAITPSLLVTYGNWQKASGRRRIV